MMNSIMLVSTGMALGLVGSLHCLGMCGPLVLMAHGDSKRKGWSSFWLATLPYHAGRILVYTLLAAVLGGLVDAATLPSWQGPISIFSGLLLLVMYFLGMAPSSPLAKHLSTWAYQMFSKQSPGSMFLAGAVNGLLPCGLSLSALVAALSYGSAWGAAQFMMGFGLGTAPALIALVGLGASLPSSIGGLARRLAPHTVLLVGLLLILRGANLGIPFLSPKWKMMAVQTEQPMNQDQPSCCH